jgi:CDP-glycerol glycerophosphotransferase
VTVTMGPKVAVDHSDHRAQVSVVVPIYNVERYLTECLESLAGQTLADLEVVLVDDGSTDSSAEIAAAFAETDPRFQLVRQANAGLGAARNTGARQATGRYLAFVDSDDVVLPDAYELLAGSLDRTGSDFATGNFYRLTTSGTRQAGMVFSTFNANRPRTHITKHPALLNDRTAWNKLFRRSFWDEHDLRWPEGVLYEDIPVTLPAHVLAKAVDVLRDPVYLWRARVGDASSITQRRIEPQAIRDRTAAVDGVSRFLAARGATALKRLYDRSVAEQDLRYFLVQLGEADRPFQQLFLDLVNDFFDRSDPAVFDDLPSLQRLEWFLVRHRLLAELLDVLEVERTPDQAGVAFERHRRAFYAGYPYRGDPDVAVPDDLYRLRSDDLPMPARVTDIRWEDDTLMISGFAYISSLAVDSADSGRLRITLEEVGHGERVVRLRTQAVLRPDVTAAAGDDVGYDWAGFDAAVPIEQLRHHGRFRTGSWRMRVERRSHGVTRRRWVTLTEPGRASRPEIRTLGGARFVPTTPAGGFQLEISAEHAVVDSVVLDGRVVEIVGTLTGPTLEPGAVLRVAREDGRGSVSVPVTTYGAVSEEPSRFVSRMDLADLWADLWRTSDPEPDEQDDGAVWQLHLHAGGDAAPLPLVVSPGFEERAFSSGDRETRLLATRTGRLVAVHGPVPPTLTRVAGNLAGFELSGRYAAPADREIQLVLVSRRADARQVLPVVRTGDEFAATIPVDAMATAGGRLPLAPGTWELFAQPAGCRPPGALLPIAVDQAALQTMPVRTTYRPGGTSLAEVGDVVRLTVPDELKPSDRGWAGQARLRSGAREHLRKPLLEQVLIDPYGPGRYADDARAVYDELEARGSGLDTVWTVERGRGAAPWGARTVVRGSSDWYEAAVRSRYVVVGGTVGLGALERRRDQVVVQTWHGVPVRQVGLDDENGTLRDGLGWARRVRAEAARWDLVPAATPQHAANLRRAFDLGGQVLRETGLPRHDVLAAPGRADERAARASAARSALQIPAGRRVVLWAPSTRPRRAGDARHFHLDLPIDPGALADRLGRDHVLVVRPHPAVVDTLPEADGDAVVDASSYPDSTDLLLACDVLVTDACSLLWDQVLTGRPIVFWLPDATAQQQPLGRRYVPTPSMPGPVVSRMDDLVTAIREVPEPDDSPAYQAMRAALGPLADGRAAARVVDQMLALGARAAAVA